MSDIDNRIVMMVFDNAAFERKLSETIRSLEKLNKTIEAAGKSKGLVEVGRHAKKIDFDPASRSAEGLLGHIKNFKLHTMVDQVSSVSASFLAMSTVAVTALSQITQAAIGAGGQVARALTIAPVMDGLSEYETNMNSIQTIMANTASKGTTMDEVNTALEELNEYSDKTIYNFAQMAKNIGAFTAAGVDLDTSVGAIKGIANLSAMSGASAEDSSRAMYQLSQAISEGRMTLMSWNSMTNANIGGEAFKKTLFETGMALGQITDVPIGTTFEEWEKKGGSFRDQLSKDWINTEVITTALSTFTGDLSATQLRSLGYTEEQTKALMDQADVAVKAATEIKTFTQLMTTIKESMGTGWATSFRLIFGNFEEAKKMWSGAYDYLNGIIGRSAEARNKTLLDWKDAGGRDSMIQGFKNLAKSITGIINPIRLAFRELFPRQTGDTLLKLTQSFERWAKFLNPTAEEAGRIYGVFKSIFQILKIGGQIVASLWTSVKQLWFAFTDGGKKAGAVIDSFVKFIDRLKTSWVDNGGIKDFFNDLTYYIINPRRALEDLISWAKNFFDTISTSEGAADFLGSLGERFTWLRGIVRMLGTAGDWFMNIFSNIPGALAGVFNKIQDFFSGIMDALTSLGSEGPVNAESVGKLVGLGFLGGIFFSLRKLLKEGLPKGANGFKDLLENINGAFVGLTDTLKAMQTKLKADALLSIALAIGVLALAVLLLSTIDPDDLTKAFIALGVGIAQLIGALQLLNSFTGSKGVAKLIVIAFAIMILAAAMNIMASAVRRMGELDMDTIGKGLLGIAGALLVMAGFMKLIEGNTSGIIRTGIGLIFVSIALIILAEAIEKFGNMDWEVMKRGFIGVAGGLLAIALAMWAMPPGMLSQSVALVAIGVALNIIRAAVEAFGNMDWDVLKQGMIAVAVSLGMIALAMWAMPRDLLVTAAGLLVVGVALNVIGAAIAGLGKMGTGDLVQGVLAIALALVAIGAAAYFMGNPTVLLGAVAITILAGAMLVLAFAIEMLSNLSIAQLATGIGALLIMLLGLGLVASVLAGFSAGIVTTSVSLLLLGIAIASIGFGLQLLGEGLSAMAKGGPKAVAAFLKSMKKILTAAPKLIESFFKAVQAALEGILSIMPTLLDVIEEVVVGLLDILRKAIPKIVQVLIELIKGLVKIVTSQGPDVIKAMVSLFDTLVQEVALKAPSIAQGLVDILITIIDTLAANAQQMTTSLTDLFVNIFEGLTDNIDRIVRAVTDFLVEALKAVADNVDELIDAYVDLWLAIFKAIAVRASDLVDGFVDMIVAVLKAVLDGMERIIDAFTDIVVAFIEGSAKQTKKIGDAVKILMDAIGDELIRAAENSVKLLEAGNKAITTFADGLDSNLPEICRAAGRIMFRLIGCIPEAFGTLLTLGASTLLVFVSGIFSRIGDMVGPGMAAVGNFVSGITKSFWQITGIAGSVISTFARNIVAKAGEYWETFKSAGGVIASAIADGLTGGLASKLWDVGQSAYDLGREAISGLRRGTDSNSPSKAAIKIGLGMQEGLVLGMKDRMGLADVEGAGGTLGETAAEALRRSIRAIPEKLEGLDIYQPTIRPELDLSAVALEARRLGDILDYANIDTSASFDQAAEIAQVTIESLEAKRGTGTAGSTILNFEQHNHSPLPLPTKVIFRKTKSALAKAKEELEIP